ncbi:MAG: YadA-like family protein, partial [Bradyrhizobium sp.]|uniref:YadA-like family protein n=1 Tax=Bradyrhizobium sp. TaxID=376 RepID=UPI00391BF5AF
GRDRAGTDGNGIRAGTGANAIAIGTGAVATGSIAIGASSAAALGNTAVGDGAKASAAAGSSAFGNGAIASASNATATGAGSSATDAGATAYGQGSTASAASATAIGSGATAGFANSTAVGAGATTTAANQVAIGTAGNTYRLAGVTSAASLAAQSGPVSFVTSDAAGNLATSSFNPSNLTSLQSQFTSLQSQVTSLQSQVMDNRFEARSGTAVALAAGSMPALQPGRKFALSAGYGNFEGANAFAIGATALLYDSKNYAIVANAGGGIGLERNVAGGRGAVSIQW